jgi:hypothetical protein
MIKDHSAWIRRVGVVVSWLAEEPHSTDGQAAMIVSRHD